MKITAIYSISARRFANGALVDGDGLSAPIDGVRCASNAISLESWSSSYLRACRCINGQRSCSTGYSSSTMTVMHGNFLSMRLTAPAIRPWRLQRVALSCVWRGTMPDCVMLDICMPEKQVTSIVNRNHGPFRRGTRRARCFLLGYRERPRNCPGEHAGNPGAGRCRRGIRRAIKARRCSYHPVERQTNRSRWRGSQ